MTMMGATSARKMTILPEGGRDFLRRRMMELVGAVIAVLGVLLLMAIFTFNAADPSLNHATGNAPANLMGLPGAYVADLLLQTFGLAICLVPVALITWGVRMVRTHHLGFFGLRLSLLLLSLLMMSVACVGLGDVGGAATHAGAGGLVGVALIGRFREFVLSHSSGGSLALIEPGCAALAFIAMAPALGMNRTDLPLIFRILRAPFIWCVWLMRAGVGLWRGKPQSLDDEVELPAPSVGYAEIPGEIDASQYDPDAHDYRREQIPEEGVDPAGARVADGRRALFADRASGAGDSRGADRTASARAARPRRRDARSTAGRTRCASAPCSIAWPACASSRSSRAAPRPRPRRSTGAAGGGRGLRARQRADPGHAGPRARGAAKTRRAEDDENPFTPDSIDAEPVAGRRRAGRREDRAAQDRRWRRASAPPGPASASSISAAASTACRRSICCRCRRASRPRPRSTKARSSRMRACSRPCSTISASRARS